MPAWLDTAWKAVLAFFASYHIITDTLDILLVAFIVYYLIRLIRDSRAEQLIKGILVMAVILFIASPGMLDLKTVYFLLRTVFNNGLLVLVVIFQPEIRRALEQAGHSRYMFARLFGLRNGEDAELARRWQEAISAVCKAVAMLQEQKMGALIVFERTTMLGEICSTGTIVDAEATPELIANIFFNKAPLHDGAMVLRDGRVYAAGCILPLSDNLLGRELGTRHRAGVGMSENSDALVLIVSEETGTLSLASAGVLKRNFSIEALRVALENGLLWERMRRDDAGKDGKKTWRKGRKK
ncbi:MAG: diadenylate cyclase CdaA [Oscillospiraceae bacterium]|nr:diadenylate cyclase CdaA [Oscillospiraceae bacterium]